MPDASDDPATLLQAKSIFLAVRTLGLAERDEVIARECGEDAALRSLVHDLLRGDAAPLPFESLAEGIRAAGESGDVGAAPGGGGGRIGNYRLLERLGEGGFGVVFMAEQERPVRRRVALKIIKLGMDTRQVVARFEAERQALAMMDHPGIARVFDAGATETGRPYFVMELVRGLPITEFCDNRRLTIRERLALLVQVCDALQHAHQRGVIHRDIKPSNVLVSTTEGDRPVPKIIDFGIAKATSARLTERTIFTEFRQMIGTPEYMSPEQAGESGEDVDTRTDVYAAGVLLYELLTGATPFDSKRLRSAAYGEMQRIIREEDPPKPSTRVATLNDTLASVAERRSTPPAKLPGTIRGELDWIVMKALEKDPSRRYGSAAAMAADIQHFLTGHAVQAAPPSRAYIARKFLRRNRRATAAAGLIAASLVLGSAISVRFGLRERTARRGESEQRAEAVRQQGIAEASAAAEHKARTRSEGTNAFVVKALRSSDPRAGGKQDTTIIEAMESAIKGIESGAFKDDPEQEATIQSTIGAILENNGRAAEAEPLYVHALETRERLFTGDHADVANSLHELANVRQTLGRTAEAEPLHIRALEMRERLFPGDNLDVASSLDSVAFAKKSLGRSAEAEPLYVRSLEMYRRLFPGDHPGTAIAMMNLAALRRQSGRGAEAEQLLVEALDMNRRLYKGDHPDLASSMVTLANARESLGRTGEAEPLLVESLAMRQRLFKGDHPDIANSLNSLALVKQSQGRPAEAEPLFAQALDMRRRLFPGDHPSVANSMDSLANTRQALGRPKDAEPLLVEALDMNRRLFPGDHPRVANSFNSLGGARQALGRQGEAEQLYTQALEMHRRLNKGDSREIASSLGNVAMARKALGRPAEAEPLYAEALEMNRRLFKGDHPGIANALNNLAGVRLTLGRPAEAEPLYAEALEMNRRLFKGDNPSIAISLANLASALNALDRTAEAEGFFLQAMEMNRRFFKGDHPNLANTLYNLAGVRLKLGRAAEAEPMFVEALEMRQRLFKGDHPDIANGLAGLADARRALGNSADALQKFDEAIAMLRRISPDGSPPLGPILWKAGCFRMDSGDAAAALPFLEEAVLISEKFLPPGHRQTTEYRGSLAKCRGVLGKQ